MVRFSEIGDLVLVLLASLGYSRGRGQGWRSGNVCKVNCLSDSFTAVHVQGVHVRHVQDKENEQGRTSIYRV